MEVGMFKKNQMIKSLATCGLLLTMMLPTFIQFVHVFGVHEHFVCTDQDSHVHQTPVKCEICTVQLTPFDFDLTDYDGLVPAEFIVQQSELLVSKHAEPLNFNSNPLRGPPFAS